MTDKLPHPLPPTHTCNHTHTVQIYLGSRLSKEVGRALCPHCVRHVGQGTVAGMQLHDS
jgi:hypothetical protein